jgi:hypothetical protein
MVLTSPPDSRLDGLALWEGTLALKIELPRRYTAPQDAMLMFFISVIISPRVWPELFRLAISCIARFRLRQDCTAQLPTSVLTIVDTTVPITSDPALNASKSERDGNHAHEL